MKREALNIRGGNRKEVHRDNPDVLDCQAREALQHDRPTAEIESRIEYMKH